MGGRTRNVKKEKDNKELLRDEELYIDTFIITK